MDIEVRSGLRIRENQPTRTTPDPCVNFCSMPKTYTLRYAGGAPVSSVVAYMAHHTGLLQQFLKQVLGKVQKFINLSPDASVLSLEQFCVVLQASREIARLMEAGATVDDIINSSFSIVYDQPTAPASKKKS